MEIAGSDVQLELPFPCRSEQDRKISDFLDGGEILPDHRTVAAGAARNQYFNIVAWLDRASFLGMAAGVIAAKPGANGHDVDVAAVIVHAVPDFAVIDQEPRYVLIQDLGGEWDETLIEPTPLN